MSVTLWVDTDADETIELGPTLPCYAAFAHMARVAGDEWESEYGALAGVLTQCELQDDADPDWLADMRRQAGEYLARFGDALTGDERDILTELAGDADSDDDIVPLTLAPDQGTDHPKAPRE